MRYHFLDNLRGLTFVSMAAFHTTYDLVYMFGVDVSWFAGPLGYIWQQSILWTFILLSGFCCGFARHQVKRGSVVFVAGLLVTLVTLLVMPSEAVFFGVLSFLGTAMMIVGLVKPQLERLPAAPALLICTVMFLVTRDVPYGYLGFEQIHLLALPGSWYANWLTTAFGFQFSGFVSADYVPFIPWIFLYLAGFFLYRIFPRKELTSALSLPQQRPWPAVSFIGRHSLGFYLVHQAVIYGVLSALFLVIR